MNLQQLRAFVAVADAGTFTAAAAALGITQSGVSHALASLEAELGVTLLHRHRDRAGAAVTDAGARVLDHARETLHHADLIRRQAAAAAGLASGKVRLGSFPSVSARLLPGILAAFRRLYPGVDIVVFEGTAPEVLDWVVNRTVDVGVVTLPVEGIDAIPIAQDDFLVVLPVSHPLAGAAALRVDQIVDEPFVLSKAGCEPAIRACFAAAGLAPRASHEVLDLGTILAMVREGVGVSILPALALPPDAPGVRAVALAPSARRLLALAVRSLAGVAPATAAFLGEARAWSAATGRLPAVGDPPSTARIGPDNVVSSLPPRPMNESLQNTSR